MKLAHRLIIKELSVTFILSVTTLLGILLMGRMIQLRELLLGQDIGVLDLLQLFFFMSPFFMLLIAPIACMLSVFLTFLRMSSDNELTALKAGGVSLYRLLLPVVLFCSLCSLGTYFIAFHGISWGMDNFRETIVTLARTKSSFAVQPGVFNQDFPKLTFYAKQTDPETGELKELFVRDATVPDAPVVIMAPQGQIISRTVEGVIEIAFQNGRIYRRNNDELNVMSFRNYRVEIPVAKLLGSFYLDSSRISEQSVSTLQRLAAGYENGKPQRDQKRVNKAKTELAKRYTLPLACLILGLFAMPVACVFRGLNQQYGLFLSLGLFLVYYTLFSVGTSLGESGVFTPSVMLWMPNILFATLSATLMFYTNRERVPAFVEWLLYWKASRGDS